MNNWKRGCIVDVLLEVDHGVILMCRESAGARVSMAQSR